MAHWGYDYKHYHRGPGAELVDAATFFFWKPGRRRDSL